MKRFSLLCVTLLCAFSLVSLPASASPASKTVPSVLGVFEGITPCTTVNRPVLQIPEDAECEMMTWHLTLEQDPETAMPTTYTLESAYGMSQPNTTGMWDGGTPLELAGTWSILTGTADDPDATIYQLNDAEGAISFVRLDDNLLHLLTQDLHMAVGNGGWSYTINRTDPPPTPIDPLAALDRPFEPAPITTTTSSGSELYGVFDGRTPCADIVYQFTKVAPTPNCAKIKWRLTLYHDPDTGVPTTYRLGVTEPIREGSWTEVRGTPADPDAVVYQLAMDDRVLNLLSPDQNHLLILDENLRLMVGDRLWSYTFSRKPQEA
jgi:hypothetical protein